MRTTDFTFKAKWVKAISLLPADYQAPAANAIIAYAYFGTLPADPFIHAFLTLIIDEIDRETRRRDKAGEKHKDIPSEQETQGTAPEEQLAAEVRRYITSHKHYSIIYRHKILKHSSSKEEADSRLERILADYIRTHPKNNSNIHSIAHVVCGFIGTGMKEIPE